MRIVSRSAFAVFAAAGVLAGCGSDDGTGPEVKVATFNVSIQNVSQDGDFFQSGVFSVPTGAASPGAIGPGQAYEFRVGSTPGGYLSFATMFVHSNDLFFAPAGSGIALFDSNDDPITSDVTDQVMLWDAGTEANEEPGVGANQAPRQSGANTGLVDATQAVRMINDEFSYPAVQDVIRVTVTHVGANEFTVRIENVSMEGTLMTSMGANLAVPLAPGVFVVHTQPEPLFSSASADRGEGLEALAEDGDPSTLGSSLAARTSASTPLAPGVWAVHTQSGPLFTSGQPDRGEGLEALAEDGSPTALAATLDASIAVLASGVFDTPDGQSTPGPATSGSTYSFSITAETGQRLSFATMFVQSNDLFLSPDEQGLALFDAAGEPVQGDLTASVQLWDAGTELNQFPGVGPDQAPRQSAANSGANDNVNSVRIVDDAYDYSPVSDVVRVTITVVN